MQLSDFHFELPDELIARYPQPDRSGSRLLSLEGNSGQVTHRQFKDILDLVEPGDLMVFNNTRVIPARVYGRKASGGKIEVLVERVLDERRFLAHVRASKAPKPGAALFLGDNGQIPAEMVARHDALFEIQLNGDKGVVDTLNDIGHMPLPPYIDRPDEDSDKERYQTVYNQKPGAVAAPTAGLHFDDGIMAALKNKGVNIAFVTLHVGAGTFQPVRVDNIEEHTMHAEYAEVPQEVVDAVNQARAQGKRVIAVGTTSVRSLESAAQAAKQKRRATGAIFQRYPDFYLPGLSVAAGGCAGY